MCNELGQPDKNFEALLLMLDDTLSPLQLAELQIYGECDDIELGFRVLCEILREADLPIPEPASDVFAELTTYFEIGTALCRDLRMH